MEAQGQCGRGRATLDGGDQGHPPVRHIQRGGFARQEVIAQRPQHHRQVAEQSFRGGILLAFAVTASPRDQPVSGGAFRVEIVNRGSGRIGIGRYG